MQALARNDTLAVPVCALVALLFGCLVALNPMLAVAAIAGSSVVAFAFAAPVLHLTLLIVATAIVPYGVLNAYGFGGGSGSAGLLLSDVLLLTGLARAAIVLAHARLGRLEAASIVVMVAFMALLVVQLARGVLGGANVSTAGNEMRALLGFATLLVALPILHDPDARERLLKALLGVGLLLGLGGLAQWFGGAAFSANGDFGVREGVAYTSGGRGQLQGGLFSYPVAVVLAFAALVAPVQRPPAVRLLIIAVLALNAICCLLTFERTMWAVSLFGCAFVALRAQRIARATLVIRGLALALVGLVVLSLAAPATFTAARERLLSIGQYNSDVSVEYRVRESQFVIREIDAQPLAGSGLGATIFWGRPKYGVPADEYSYTHNGYLWTAWKLGLPGALLLLAMWLVAIMRRGAPQGSPTFATVVVGAQGALAALLIANVTFPSVSAGSSTATVGMLLALSFFGRRAPESSAANRRS